jgi:hypothetical protein
MHRLALRRLVERAPVGSTVSVLREALLELLQIDDFDAEQPTEEQAEDAQIWFNHLVSKGERVEVESLTWLRAWIKVRLGEEVPVK